MSQQYLHFSIHISSSKVPCTYVYVQHPQEFIWNIVEFRELSFVIKYKAVLLVQSESRFQTIQMNVVVEWLTLLLRIYENPGSKSQSEDRLPDWGFSWFFSVPPGECRVSSTLILGQDRFLPNPFQFTIHLGLPPFHSMLVLVTEKQPLNKL
jgi:hypothetical protein